MSKERVRLKKGGDESPPSSKKGLYYEEEFENEDLVFFSSGCVLTDLVLGGGWPLRRVSNIIGDKSTGKTGMAIEAMVNFYKRFPDGLVNYQEVESAFDKSYAKRLGLDFKKIKLIENIETVSETQTSVYKFLEKIAKKGVPGLYVVDTLDAIHDRHKTDKEGKKVKVELAEGFDQARRAAAINSLVTQFVGDFKRANANLLLVSQVRENIGVMFGEKYRRAGGKALDFYASQCLWLAQIKELKRTIDGIKNTYAILVKAKCKKNKVGVPFRSCEYPIEFFYGIDDVTASIDWLKSVKALDDFLEVSGLTKSSAVDKIKEAMSNGKRRLKNELDDAVKGKWHEIEKGFMPKYAKY